MGMGSCYNCVKYMMFAFNFLFWLLGCTMIGVGIWVLVDEGFKKFVNEDGTFNYLHRSAYVLITVGVIIMVIGFLGCCGAIRENQCCLATFFVCIFILFGILLAVGIWGIVAKGSLKEKVTSQLRRAVNSYHTDPASKVFMDNVQTYLKCCGVNNGIIDYGIKPPCGLAKLKHGCADKLYDFINEHVIIIAGVCIGIGVVMLFGMWFACFLCCAIRRAEPSYHSVKQ